MSNVFDPRLDFQHLEPVNDGPPVVDCFLCAKPGVRAKMNKVEQGLFPRMYFHAACGVGRRVQDIQIQYLASVRGLFGGPPFMPE